LLEVFYDKVLATSLHFSLWPKNQNQLSRIKDRKKTKDPQPKVYMLTPKRAIIMTRGLLAILLNINKFYIWKATES